MERSNLLFLISRPFCKKTGRYNGDVNAKQALRGLKGKVERADVGVMQEDVVWLVEDVRFRLHESGKFSIHTQCCKMCVNTFVV
eukprot:7830114-Ditylum_brightwellii.AAC.1